MNCKFLCFYASFQIITAHSQILNRRILSVSKLFYAVTFLVK